MMQHWYVEKEPNARSNFEIHRDGCNRLPSVEKRTYLGMFRDCRGAVERAGRLHLFVVDCARCAPQCRSS